MKTEEKSDFHDLFVLVKGMVIRMKKQKSGGHYKKWCVAAGICMMTAALCGCGGKYPELTEDEEQVILKYAATLLYDNDQNRDSRLMTEDEMILAMQRRAAHAYMPEPEPEPTPDADTEPDQSGTQPADDLIGGGETVETRTLAEFFGFPGIDISYQGYFFTKSYPEESGDEFYFAMDALYGNELLILQYTITNQNAAATQVDILDLKPRFRLFINDGEQINAMTTLLLDDMKTTNRTLEPGESCAVVVVFEVTEEEAASVQQLKLTVKTEDDSWTVPLLESEGQVLDGDDGPEPAETLATGMTALSYELPQEFIGQGDGMYVAPDYPDDTANINVIESQYDPETFEYTEEAYCEDMEYAYKQLYDYDVTVHCTEFTKSELNGCRTLLTRLSFNLWGTELEQVQFAIGAGESGMTVITYTQPAGGPWMDAFNASIDSVHIENAE